MAKDLKQTSRTPLSAVMKLGFALSFFSGIVGLVYMAAIAVEKVKSGQGLDTFRNFWLEEDNWIGFLVFCGAAVVATIIGLVLRFREHRYWRALEAKYEEPKGDA